MFEELAQHWDGPIFDQTTGMVSVQINTRDVVDAACHLVTMASSRGQSIHEVAFLVVDRQLQAD